MRDGDRVKMTKEEKILSVGISILIGVLLSIPFSLLLASFISCVLFLFVFPDVIKKGAN